MTAATFLCREFAVVHLRVFYYRWLVDIDIDVVACLLFSAILKRERILKYQICSEFFLGRTKFQLLFVFFAAVFVRNIYLTFLNRNTLNHSILSKGWGKKKERRNHSILLLSRRSIDVYLLTFLLRWHQLPYEKGDNSPRWGFSSSYISAHWVFQSYLIRNAQSTTGCARMLCVKPIVRPDCTAGQYFPIATYQKYLKLSYQALC